jgi:gamma-glutamyl phosphate reductase
MDWKEKIILDVKKTKEASIILSKISTGEKNLFLNKLIEKIEENREE